MPGPVVAVPIASKLHDPKLVDPALERLRAGLAGLVDAFLEKVTDPGQLAGRPELSQASGIVAVVLTGGTEQLALAIAEGYRKPMLLYAHPAQNSLAASLEAAAAIAGRGLFVKVALEGELRKVEQFARAARALAALRGSRVLLIGDPSPWLVYSSGVEGKVERDFGLKVERVGLGELLELYDKVSREEAAAELERLGREWGIGGGVPRQELEKSAALYLALKRLLEAKGARLATIRCFDLLPRRVTACLPVAVLNGEGFAVGCEADLPAEVTMAALSQISGRPAMIANLAWVRGREALFAHCTVALPLVRGFSLTTHFESGLGVAVEGYPRRGEVVTFAKVDPRAGEVVAGRGRVVNDEPPMRGVNCRTQVLVEVEELGSGLGSLLRRPAGTHYVLTYGDHVEALSLFAEMVGYSARLV